MEYISSGKILVVDLATGNASDEELSDDLVSQKIGGVGITSSLYQSYADEDPIILGTGAFTGSLVPGSALAIFTAKSPRTGTVCHSPVTFKAGMELKFAGFDYVVIKGKSPKPVLLWVHDGIADVVDAGAMWGKDIWEAGDDIRKNMGDDLIQTLLIGKAGESGSDLAQIGINYGGGTDRWGFGKIFGDKNLKGIALRGMGLLEISDAEGFVDECLEMLGEVKKGACAGKSGIGDIMVALGEKDAKEWLAPLVHRNSACYNMPCATSTFICMDEDPKVVVESEKPEPGVLLSDVYGLLAFKKAGFSLEQAGRALKACCKCGIDPVAVAELAVKEGKKDAQSIEQALASMKGPVSASQAKAFSPWAPLQPVFADFGALGDEKATMDWWMRRQALAYIFGIHPVFVTMSPEVSEERMLKLMNIGTGLEVSQETLDGVIAGVCS